MSIKVIKAPKRELKSDRYEFSVFLAGSIEMGKAKNWQNDLEKKLQTSVIVNHIKDQITLFNPRRNDWDSSWKQDINEANFYEQVTWELDRIQNSDLVVFYFDPETKSPITLLELGLCIGKNIPCVVCCPPGYWRKGNVDITCYINGIHVVDDLDSLTNYIISCYYDSHNFD